MGVIFKSNCKQVYCHMRTDGRSIEGRRRGRRWTDKVRKLAWFKKMMDGTARAIYDGDEEKHLRRFLLQAEHYARELEEALKNLRGGSALPPEIARIHDEEASPSAMKPCGRRCQFKPRAKIHPR